MGINRLTRVEILNSILDFIYGYTLEKDNYMFGLSTCDVCGKVMSNGFIVDDIKYGISHYCSKKCLNDQYTDDEYEKIKYEDSELAKWTMFKRFDPVLAITINFLMDHIPELSKYKIDFGNNDPIISNMYSKLTSKVQERDVMKRLKDIVYDLSYEGEFRICNHCKRLMIEGYVIENGDGGYYCSDECLNKDYTEEEYNNLYDDGDGDTYWTKWECFNLVSLEIANHIVELFPILGFKSPFNF